MAEVTPGYELLPSRYCAYEHIELGVLRAAENQGGNYRIKLTPKHGERIAYITNISDVGCMGGYIFFSCTDVHGHDLRFDGSSSPGQGCMFE